MHCVGYQIKSRIIGVFCVRNLQSCLLKLVFLPVSRNNNLLETYKVWNIGKDVSFLKILKTSDGNPSRKPLDFWCRCLDLEPDVGSQTKGIMRSGSQRRAICRAESQRRAKEAR